VTLSKPRSVTLNQEGFDAIAALAYKEIGLTLVREKSTMVQSRLRHRLRALGIADFSEYSAFIQSNAGKDERRHLICALTTNVSQFFRETHHFDQMCHLVRQALPRIKAGARFRIWSAGCSHGQEPLSAAMSLLGEMPELGKLDFRILATDIDEQVIKFARQGRYSARQVANVPQAFLGRYFTPEQARTDTAFYVARPEVMDVIRYNELNLLGPWPMQHKFDIILCRNVVIYFDLSIQESLWSRFQDVLRPDGQLFLGHSERIAAPAAHNFKFIGPTTYGKMSSMGANPPQK